MNFIHYKFSVLEKNRKALLLCGFIFVISSIFFCKNKISLAEDSATAVQPTQEEAAKNQALINQKLDEIKQIQEEISKYQTNINQKQKEQKTLNNEIAIYDNNILKNQAEIKETKINIEKAELEIEWSKNKVVEDQGRIEKNKESLKNYIQTLYEYQDSSFIEILISKDNISDFFNEVNAIKSVQNKIFDMVVNLKKEKEELAVRGQELEDNQTVYQDLIEMRYKQNSEIENLKAQKNEILEITNGEEDKFQNLMAQNRTLLPSLRAELRDLQSLGSNIKFDDAISAAQYIGSVTGVRPALLLGVLRIESGLGTNVGGGKYTVDMNPNQRATFEAITQELGYDPNVMPVSRRPSSYSGWGGAMGPAQMLPTTWVLYKDKVSQITKNSPADPWDLADSIAAMALKLSQVEGVTSGNRDAEYKAAGIYLAGNNWQKFPFYPNKVMYYADLYDKELNG